MKKKLSENNGISNALKKIKHKGYSFCLLTTLLICILMSIYHVLHGQEMVATHMDTQFAIAVYQIYAAVIISVAFALNKYTRKLFWFLIPAILVLFAFIYVIIVSQYPCCSVEL